MTGGSADPSTGGRGDRSVPRLIDRFEFHVTAEPEALAFAAGTNTLSRAELWLASGIAAEEIRSAVDSDQRAVVVVHLPDSAAWLAMFLAVLRAGHICARLPVTARAQDFLHVFEKAEPAMVISSAQGCEQMPVAAVQEVVSYGRGVALGLAEGTAVDVRGRAEDPSGPAPLPDGLLLLDFKLDETGPPEALAHSEESLDAQNQYMTERYGPSRQVPVLLPCPLPGTKTIVDAASLSLYAGAPLIIRDTLVMAAFNPADHKV